MLKSCGRKLLLSLVGSMFTCLLVLMVEPPGRPGLARGEAGGAQRALQSLGVAVAPPAAQGPPGLRSFADYFGRLSRARRELPAAPPSPPRPPAEDISPRDVFIAVKTTKKFHKARLELLLDTWISRNRDMVRGWGRSVRQPGWSGRGRAAVPALRRARSVGAVPRQMPLPLSAPPVPLGRSVIWRLSGLFCSQQCFREGEMQCCRVSLAWMSDGQSLTWVPCTQQLPKTQGSQLHPAEWFLLQILPRVAFC